MMKSNVFVARGDPDQAKLWRWISYFIIGFITGLIAFLMEITEEYMVEASRAAGHGGAFRSSAVEIECADSGVCGELSVYAVLHGMPAAPDRAAQHECRGST